MDNCCVFLGWPWLKVQKLLFKKKKKGTKLFLKRAHVSVNTDLWVGFMHSECVASVSTWRQETLLHLVISSKETPRRADELNYDSKDGWPNSDLFIVVCPLKRHRLEPCKQRKKHINADVVRLKSGLFPLWKWIRCDWDFCQCACRLSRHIRYRLALWVTHHSICRSRHPRLNESSLLSPLS